MGNCPIYVFVICIQFNVCITIVYILEFVDCIFSNNKLVNLLSILILLSYSYESLITYDVCERCIHARACSHSSTLTLIFMLTFTLPRALFDDTQNLLIRSVTLLPPGQLVTLRDPPMDNLLTRVCPAPRLLLKVV